MKIRKGFVSNSSSSSFMCDICGDIESGMDAGMSDFDMVSCVNGHTFHTGCSKLEIPDFTLEEKKKHIINCINRSTWRSNKDKLNQIKEINTIEDENELEEVYQEYISDEGIPEQFCPLCQFLEMTDSDKLKYLMKKLDVSDDRLLAEVKEKFKNYKDFCNYIKEERK